MVYILYAADRIQGLDCLIFINCILYDVLFRFEFTNLDIKLLRMPQVMPIICQVADHFKPLSIPRWKDEGESFATKQKIHFTVDRNIA